MTRTLKQGRESGAHYEIQSVKDIILSKEAKGISAEFERGLLESWSKHKGYKSAKQVLDNLGKPNQ